MTSEYWGRLSEIFAEVLDMPPGEREAFLDRCCAGNPSLRQEVEEMLRAEANSGGFLEEPVPAPRLPNELPGGWKLAEKLGEGGMGAVYRARRVQDGFEQHAAVKILQYSQLSMELARRLRAERKILATLQHPNITRLLDGGTVEGVPFLVMELVEGIPLLDYCKEAKLSVRQRLALFLEICGAVQYAHQKLVVHRDIKPSNILVTDIGEPKLLDFGIAKMIERQEFSRDKTSTMYRALSVNYASPEQLRGEPVSTATDIYSLGTLLFEMLSGERRDFSHLDTPEAVAKEIEKQPLPKASSFRRGISKDLDAIVEKAARPEASARYESVEQFATDLRRHLEGLPVKARNGTIRYVAGKFIARNKFGIAVSLAMFAGLVAFVWAAWQTANERHRAEEQLKETRAIAGMMAMYIPGHIVEFPGSLNLRRKMVSYGLAYLDKQTSELDPADAKQRRQLALGYFNVGNTLGGPSMSNLGDFEEASRCYRKVIDLLWQEGPPSVRDEQARSAVALSLTRRAETLLRIRRPAEALQAAEDCIQRSVQSTEDPIARAELTCRGTRLRAMTDLGRTVSPAEIEDLLQRETQLDDAQGSIFGRMSNKYLAARLYFQMKDYPKALEYARSGLDVAAGPNRGHSVSIQRGRLLELTAHAEAELGDKERATSRFDESFDVLRELVRKEPEEVESRTQLARTLLESRALSEDPKIKKARLVEAESLVRGVLNDAAYPAARFMLVRILSAQADEQNSCSLRNQAVAEFERLVAAGQTLPSDAPVIEAIRAKVCPSAPRQP